MVLSQVGEAVAAITDQKIQGNIAAASAVLAGIVLKKDVIRKIFRSEIMRESVIYQEILEEGEAKGIAKGEAKGEAKGIAETTKKLALNLLRIGMRLQQISEVTELSLEQVQALEREIKNPTSN
ncbi:hypothetical protein [Anabaena sp. AL09]|jgi:predicted transposase/invertase (TIGR01784 family)|uniref:hypothetical protein n=1 Tax=Anabaena sp. AL09 TaxID=1710891 RepID=UPI000B134673|nr:hypothetical protein [Anabaena sp. AL09]